MNWSSPYLIGAAVFVMGTLTFWRVWPPWRTWRRRMEAERGIREFRLKREFLEARFFDIAAALGKPRGLKWLECDWQEAVTFARDHHSGLLTAFVAVSSSGVSTDSTEE